MHLILIGGAKGVGKTTIIKRYAERHPVDCAFSSRLYWQHKDHYPFPQIKEMMLEDILARTSPILLVDTHYANLSRQYGIRPAWSPAHLARIADAPHISGVRAYLLYASPESVRDRRKNDRDKLRRVDIRSIRGDLEANERYFPALVSFLKERNRLVDAGRIENTTLDATVTAFEERIGHNIYEP